MVSIPTSALELMAAFASPTDFNLDLPDPEDEGIEEVQFQEQLDNLWKFCDRCDLQTDIWRGRILRAVRDREKKGGDGRGTGFLNWLKEREITKSHAYNLIQLANSADTLLAEGKLDPTAINNFSKRAFVETAKASPEVQLLVTETAQNGNRVTCREVKQLTDQWMAMSSEILPEEVKEKAVEGSLPTRHLAPLVKEMEKLPEIHLKQFQEQVSQSPDVDTVKLLTSSARTLAKYLDSAAQVQTLKGAGLDLEMALDEALRLDCLDTAADLVKIAGQLEQIVGKFYTTWKRLGTMADRLYVDTGASTPNLRRLLTTLESLSKNLIEVPLDETLENLIRLKIINDSDLGD